MSFNRNHLALFQAVAEEGSFGRGAARMHVSQPAVSKQVALLEEAVGLRLLDRLPRGVALTAAGETLLGYVRRIEEIERQADFALGQMRGLKAGRLAVGASTTIGSYLLPDVLGSFRRQYPGIEITVDIGNTRQIEKQITAHRIDVGLTEGLVKTASPAAFEAEVFHEDELVVIAPPGHPLCLARRVQAQHLLGYPMLMRESGSGTRAVIEKALEEKGLTIPHAMSIGSTEAIKRAVAAGMGIAIVSRLTVTQELLMGRLAIVSVRGLKIPRPLHRLQSVSAAENAIADAFVDVLEQTLTRGSGAIKPRRGAALNWSI